MTRLSSLEESLDSSPNRAPAEAGDADRRGFVFDKGLVVRDFESVSPPKDGERGKIRTSPVWHAIVLPQSVPALEMLGAGSEVLQVSS
jgi:hypothetical protein